MLSALSNDYYKTDVKTEFIVRIIVKVIFYKAFIRWMKVNVKSYENARISIIVTWWIHENEFIYKFIKCIQNTIFKTN